MGFGRDVCMDAREQITALREKLQYHNDKYYNQDAPEILALIHISWA